MDVTSFLENVSYIHERYIAESAEYAINIPSALRKNFKTYAKLFAPHFSSTADPSRDLAAFSAFSAKQTPIVVARFMNLLNEGMEKIVSLLKFDSLVRFKTSDAFCEAYGRLTAQERQRKASSNVREQFPGTTPTITSIASNSAAGSTVNE